MKTLLQLEFGRKFTLNFRILPHQLAQSWAEQLVEACKEYTLDDPRRFYGFGTIEQQAEDALGRIQEDIKIINGYQPIVERTLETVDDQDTLNYLHNIFERYHGLLNQQNTSWWKQAPEEVQKALARLNIDVHRCEAVSRGGAPRFVCTWWDMPKTKQMTPQEMHTFGELKCKFGGVYLNYVEIGKTLEDLTLDNDCYIGDDAFQPAVRYSADFNVRFYNREPNLKACAEYYYQHQEFFEARGIDSPMHYKAIPYRYCVAELGETDMLESEILDLLAQNQEVTGINIQ